MTRHSPPAQNRHFALLRTAARFTAIAMLGVTISACGDDGINPQEAEQLLKAHFKQHPPKRDWKVMDVFANTKGELVINIDVKSDADVRLIKSKSSMERFNIARMVCPQATPALQAVMNSEIRIWVRLRTDKEELIKSICPHD